MGSTSDYLISGAAPAHVAAPRSRDEAVEVIRQAAERGEALVSYGGGTQIETGWPPRAGWTALSTAHLNGVVDYQPDDMTLTVEPGITLAEVERILRERNQFLPLNPPLPERATVGGTIAAAAAGPWQAGWGTPRDWVIGCRVLGADGKEVRGGGQVVKNVAGYDLPKLYTGSYGTLGLITEVTFKVMPWPGGRGYCAATLPTASAAEALLARLMDSDVQPAAAELSTGRSGDWTFHFEFLHVPEAIDWQLGQVAALADAAGGSARRLDESAGAAELAALRDRPARSAFAARLATVSGGAARLMDELRVLLPETLSNPGLISHAWTGRVNLCLDAADAALATEVRALAGRHGATCVFTRLPIELTGQLDPWGDAGTAFRLMRGLKETLDPDALFSPGRFVGRL